MLNFVYNFRTRGVRDFCVAGLPDQIVTWHCAFLLCQWEKYVDTWWFEICMDISIIKWYHLSFASIWIGNMVWYLHIGFEEEWGTRWLAVYLHLVFLSFSCIATLCILWEKFVVAHPKNCTVYCSDLTLCCLCCLLQ